MQSDIDSGQAQIVSRLYRKMCDKCVGWLVGWLLAGWLGGWVWFFLAQKMMRSLNCLLLLLLFFVALQRQP